MLNEQGQYVEVTKEVFEADTKAREDKFAAALAITQPDPDSLHRAVTMSNHKIEVWALPFHFDEPFKVGYAYSMLDCMKMIVRFEQEAYDCEVTLEELFFFKPSSVVEYYGNIEIALNEEVVSFIERVSDRIVAAISVDWDETDTYVMVKEA
jgi:hypothetical protein